MRESALIVSLLPISALLAFNATTVQAASLDRQVAFSIPSQPLDGALLEFSRQADIQLALDADELDRIQAPELKGTLAASVALRRLLSSSGYRYYTVGNTVTVRRTAGVTEEGSTSSDSAARADTAPIAQHYIAAVAPDADQSSGHSKDESRQASASMAEVLVSAEKREERLQDVPVPVTAIQADTLIQTNQLRLQDYYTSVPGLSVTPGQFRGDPVLAIRGVTTGGTTNPTVGIVVDDVPYGSSSSLGGGLTAPDLDPSDLSRIEVLRGPQGTLYGASSIGGLLKFVTVDPSTDKLSGRLQGGVSSVYAGNEVGYNVRGAANVPLTDTIAIRASAFARKDPGYIYDVQTAERSVNSTDVDGARLSGLWKPSSTTSLKISALFQDLKVHGSPEIEPTLGDLLQDTLRGTGGYKKTFQIYSAIFNAKLGAMDLTSITGYSINRLSDLVDYSPAYGPYTAIDFGVAGAPLAEQNKTSKFTQEVRLAAPVGKYLDALVGLFYTHEKSPFTQEILAVDPATGASVGTEFRDTIPTTFSEYAIFTDLTFHVTDQFDLQFGGRASQNRQTYSEIDSGPLVGGELVNPEVDTKDSSFTYLITPEFKITPDLMVYARLASGYRPGGPNPTSTLFGLPPHFDPDKTQNYELGLKGDALDQTLSFDLSVYYIDWKNIQLSLVAPNGFGYYANASRAKSQGAEVSFHARPLKGLTIEGWVALNDAKLTEGFPETSAAYGVDGDRLPYSSRLSTNLSINQQFQIANDVIGFVGGAVSYVGGRKGEFTGTPERQDFPAYAKTDLRAGVNFESWDVTLFASNIFDRRGVLSGGLGTVPNPLAFNYIQPLTIGLSLSKSF